MSTPQEPEDEPVGDELPAEQPEAISAEDALWRAIVENYGERPAIDDLPDATTPPPRAHQPPPSEDVREQPPAPASEEHFVPPEPPPMPTPPPARLLAWIGLFGVPAFVLVALVAQIDLAAWTGLLLMGWFVGGFVFLVASMRPGPGEDNDDGARL